MHDPMTVAHEIKYPWYRHRPWPKRLDHLDTVDAWERMNERERSRCDKGWRDGYREAMVTVWHVDPEKGGSDDSCNRLYGMTRMRRERLKSLAWSEARNPYFLRCNAKEWDGTRNEAECLYRGLLLAVARCIDVPMTFDEAAAEAARTIHHPDCVDPAGVFCFVPGYHTNFATDSREYREEHFYGRVYGIARWILRDRRSRWRHPRWHLHHWRIQVHPIQGWWHRNFAKCDECGRRMGRGTRIGTCWDTPHVAWWKRLFMRKPWYVRHEGCGKAEAAPAEVMSEPAPA